MCRHRAQTLAEDRVVTVGFDSADRIHRVQVLDRKLRVVLGLRVFAEVTLNVSSDVLYRFKERERGTYDTLDITRLILNHVLFLDPHLFVHDALFFLD